MLDVFPRPASVSVVSRWLLLAAVCALPAVMAVPASAADEAAATSEIKVGDLTLTVPKSWKQTEPSSRLRLAQFSVPTADGEQTPTDVVVFCFGGSGGGADANIRRWIGQFDAEGRKVKVSSGKSKHGPYIFVDLDGTWKMPVGPPVLRRTKPVADARMQAVILAVEGKGIYFLRLTVSRKSV